MPPRTTYDTAQLKDLARGAWDSVFQDLAGVDRSTLDGQHHPCPKCGGTDRFRMIDTDAGALHCNQCFSQGNGDGIAALQWLCGWTFPETLERLSAHFYLNGNNGQGATHLVSQGEDVVSRAGDSPNPTQTASPVTTKDPARSLDFLPWFEPKAVQWVRTKPGVSVYSLELAGARLATHLKKHNTICLPAWSSTDTSSAPTGWVLMERSGGTLPVFHPATKDSPAKPPTWEKVKVSSGSIAGICNAHALAILNDPIRRAAVRVIWKVEGVSDMLAIQSIIPPEVINSHLVLTNSDGCGGRPKKWLLELISQCPGLERLFVIHDCDRPGQNGAVGYCDAVGKVHQGWCQYLAAFARPECIVRNVVLPFPLVESHGQDVRDWINAGTDADPHNYAALTALAATGTAIPRPAVLTPPASTTKPADPFTDGVPDGLVCNGIPNPNAGESDDAPEVTALAMPAILRRIQHVADNWPRRVGPRLFVHDQNTDNPIHWLDKPDSLFGFLGTVGQFGPPRFYTTAGFHSKAEVFSELCRLAPSYKAIETVPHEPPIRDHYYACQTIEPTPEPAQTTGDSFAPTLADSPSFVQSHLDQLLDRFSPSTPLDRDLILSMFATAIWGGPGGSRPMFVVTSRDGRGAGKSTLAECVGQLVGGLMSFSSGEDAEEMKKRLLSPEGRPKRVALIDNLKTHRFSWAELEALVTAREISGKQMYQGEGSKPNTLTWCVTMNGLATSTDISQRSVIIFVDRPKHSGEWAEETNSFIENFRREIIADLIAFLRRPATPLPKSTRWGTWERAVLSRLPEPSEAQRIILERQKAADVEDEETGIVTDYIWQRLVELNANFDNREDYERDHRVFIPSSVMRQWFCEATGERPTATAVSRMIKQRIDEGSMPQLALSSHRGHGRGFVYCWSGHIGNNHPVRYDLEKRIAGIAAKSSDIENDGSL